MQVLLPRVEASPVTQVHPERTAEAGVVDLPEINFPHGLPGFPESTRFALVQWGADPLFAVMVDLGQPEVRFLVVPPDAFFPGYAAQLDDTTVAVLDLTDPQDALILVILTVPADGAAPTANLLGPIVINVRTRTGVQAVLSDSEYDARTELPH